MKMIFKRVFYWLDRFRSYNIFNKSIFIIAAPRSGSTLLYDFLRKNLEGFYGYSVETDDVWWEIFPRERLKDQSDLVTAQDCTQKKIKDFRRLLYRRLIWDLEEQGEKANLIKKLGLLKINYIEKTIANCFHLEAIEKIFPESYYIWLIRDPRAVYSSMLVGWKGSNRAEIYNKINPLTQKFTKELFPYPLPPNWSKYMKNKTEAEAFVWALIQYIEFPKKFFQNISSVKFIKIRYEDFVKNPSQIIKNISRKFNLKYKKKENNKLPLSRTTVTKPQKDKWKRLHGHIIESQEVKPYIKNLLNILDYE